MVIMEYNRFPAEKSRAFVQITGEKVREEYLYAATLQKLLCVLGKPYIFINC